MKTSLRLPHWAKRSLLYAVIAGVFACTDVTFDEQTRPSFAAGDVIGPAEVPHASRNDIPSPWSSTGIALTAGLPYRITASGMLSFTDNPGYHAHQGCVPHPSYPSTVGPAGFNDSNHPWAVRAGMGTATNPPGTSLTFKPPLSASNPEMSTFVKGPGTVWVSRPTVLPYSCGGPGFDEPAWFVSGAQQIQAVELELPNLVPNRLSVPVGDTVLFTLQVAWSTSFFIGSGIGYHWVSDTTTNNSTLVNCPRTQLTCRVIVREKGHLEVQNVMVENMSFDARSPVVVIGAPQFTVTANPNSLTSPQSVTFTAAVNTSLAWSLSGWTWTPDSGAQGGIDPNGCTTSEKTCVRTISKAGWMKATATIAPYTLTDSAHVSFQAEQVSISVTVSTYTPPQSFTAKTEEHQITLQATVTPATYASQVEWNIVAHPDHFPQPSLPGSLTGANAAFNVSALATGRWPTPHATDIALAPKQIGYRIKASVRDASGQLHESNTVDAVQDEIDTMREEYVEFNVFAGVPARSQFALQTRIDPGVNTGDYGYMVWHTAFVDALNALSVSWQSEGQWQINSQYRNPVHQQLHLGGATNSKHQYGCAADLQTYPVNPTNSVDSASAWDFWHRLAELARSQSFVVEDSLASGIGHVHVQEFC